MPETLAPGLLAVAVCLASPPCDEPSTPPPPAPFERPLWERSALTGDWIGHRTSLREAGVPLNISSTQFYQGVATGGLDRSFRYGGRNDYFLNLHGEKLGLWQGLFVDLHGETRYGQAANDIGGTLSPVNHYLKVPADQGNVTALTGVKVTQFVSENIMAYAGKINVLDEVKQPLTGATGLNGFMNTAFIFNLAFARTVPYSTYSAGIGYVQDNHPVALLAVFDTNNIPTVAGFNTFFDNGATVAGLVNLPTNFFGLPGHQGIGGTYSSGRYTYLRSSSYLDPIEGLISEPQRITGSWCLTYNFDQAIYASPEDPKRVFGVFGHLGIADDNPNPVTWFGCIGLSGASPLPRRSLDTFGIGFYHIGVSGPLKDSALPPGSLGNESGIEVFYRAVITPWFSLTPDLQVINAFQKRADTTVLIGLRGKVDF